jgi:hypothetical protein
MPPILIVLLYILIAYYFWWLFLLLLPIAFVVFIVWLAGRIFKAQASSKRLAVSS